MTTRNVPFHLSLDTQHGDKHPSGSLAASISHLTPPVTPTGDSDPPSRRLATPRSHESLSTATDQAAVFSPLEFPEEVEFHHDGSGSRVELGRGVWSIVYMASSRAPSTVSSMTPPSSPATASRVLAVKSPVRRDAQAVIYAEAKILTRLSLTPGHKRYVVPFRGYISRSQSIVMSALPLSLATYIEDKAGIARENMSTRTMFDPVQGLSAWHEMAERLIAGLSWLHNEAQIVHGDLKPHNLLLRPRRGSSGSNSSSSNSDDFPYDPVFADFSSAYDMSCASPGATGTSISAMTPPFTAPELLSVASLTSPDSAPTPASDVFSLAVTLLAAATGDLLVYPGSSNMQRLAMAREGHRVLDFARSGANGTRIPRKGLVERIVQPATVKEPSQRITAAKWVDLSRQ
ncbi:hypothetical protein ASPZODRAFT_130730 [Penicilliopsis zonata CBS 506.65]|uniref:Protein kinase domain-containing protein n=1 Tax=Penicilliopsis zonata CBS 506.65 TaxID=1073090 RepID=A0A1L9SN48_9EURO|nr:hypothetical protein ASPZODRAFT_130730 [Penicilliopsis zonata CBS 506.65]OJJ48630.1 hypothetical protein ASPZODRAFT_130730 [Penicilliopsis zonata CBS 506.65]